MGVVCIQNMSHCGYFPMWVEPSVKSNALGAGHSRNKDRGRCLLQEHPTPRLLVLSCYLTWSTGRKKKSFLSVISVRYHRRKRGWPFQKANHFLKCSAICGGKFPLDNVPASAFTNMCNASDVLKGIDIVSCRVLTTAVKGHSHLMLSQF
jgi:hypothetical protein